MARLESGSGLFICPTPHEVTASLWTRKSQVEKVSANYCWYQCDDHWKTPFLRIPYRFSWVFVGLALPVLLFRFCGAFVWFYYLHFTCPSSATFHGIISPLFRKCHPFFARSCSLGSHAATPRRLQTQLGLWGWSWGREGLQVIRNLTFNGILKRKENSSFYY